ncbi:MobF family relaxase [Streptomyces olivaceoviridis]|uniref:MobF family relaxase n=1 Tax=Streptomyces olivaceoviridis TaxID=1921 RepID=UPI0037A53D7D
MRGVAFGDGRRPVGQSLKDAQEMAGLPPGRWLGLGVAALGLTEGAEVSERQMELVFGQGRHPDADRIQRGLLDDGADPATARLATVLGQPIEEIEARNQTPLLALDFAFRPQASLIVLWVLGDARTRRIIERAHERAIAKVLRWLEDEVAQTRWSSGRGRAKTPALVVAAFRHFDNRDGFPLLHDHCLVLNRVQRRGDDGELVWGALDTVRLYRNVVAAGTLYTLAMTTEVCEELGLATVPREVTPGLRPVMEIAGVDSELIAWSSTRRQRIEDVLEGLTYKYAQEQGRLPGERARHGLGWQAAQDTRPEKKTPRPLKHLLAWWRASALLKFGKEMVDGLLRRCRSAGAAIRARVDPRVDAVLAAADVAAVVSTVRGKFARRHVLAEARRHLLETLRGQEFTRGLDDYIADRVPCPTIPVSPPFRSPAAGLRMPTSSSIPPTSPSPITGGSPAPTASLPASRAGTSGPGSPASPCRTRFAPPVPRPPPHGTTPRPPGTRKTTTIRRQTRRTPSTSQAGMPCSPQRSGLPPFRPISRPRCPRSTSRAVRPTRLRGCAHRRTWNGSPPSPARPTHAAAPSRPSRSPSSPPTWSSPPTSSSTTRTGPTTAGERAVTGEGWQPARAGPICDFHPRASGSRTENRGVGSSSCTTA